MYPLFVATPENWLLCNRLRALLAQVEAGAEGAETLWQEAEASIAAAGADEDADIALPVWERDLPALRRLIGQWDDGTGHLPEWDRAVLKRALKAYRKRLKITVLEAESSVAGGPMSAGRKSAIVGIVPPERYPSEVWDELVRQKRLVYGGYGTYELAPGV